MIAEFRDAEDGNHLIFCFSFSSFEACRHFEVALVALADALDLAEAVYQQVLPICFHQPDGKEHPVLQAIPLAVTDFLGQPVQRFTEYLSSFGEPPRSQWVFAKSSRLSDPLRVSGDAKYGPCTRLFAITDDLDQSQSLGSLVDLRMTEELIMEHMSPARQDSSASYGARGLDQDDLFDDLFFDSDNGSDSRGGGTSSSNGSGAGGSASSGGYAGGTLGVSFQLNGYRDQILAQLQFDILEQFGLLQGCVSIRTPEALANLVSRRVPEVIIISGRHGGEGSL